MAETLANRAARERTVAAVAAAGGDEVLLERVAGTETLQQIANSLDVSRWSLTKYLEQPEREEAYRAAVRASAGALMDEATAIVDRNNDTTGAVARDKLRAGHRQHLASARDPETFGQRSKLDLSGAGDLGYGLVAALMDYGQRDAPGMVRLRERGELPTLEAEVEAKLEEAEVDFESPA